jgi:hypothetical protein
MHADGIGDFEFRACDDMGYEISERVVELGHAGYLTLR